MSAACSSTAARAASTKLRLLCQRPGRRKRICVPSGTRSGGILHFSSARQFTRSGVSGWSAAIAAAGWPRSVAFTTAAVTSPISAKSVIAPPSVPRSRWLPKVP